MLVQPLKDNRTKTASGIRKIRNSKFEIRNLFLSSEYGLIANLEDRFLKAAESYGPFYLWLERKIKHVYIMSGNRFKLGLFSRVEWLAMVPRVLNGRENPEVAFGITHNPLLGRPLYKQGHSCDHPFSSLWHTHTVSRAHAGCVLGQSLTTR